MTSHALPLDGLGAFLEAEIAGAPPGGVALLAGHYAIFSAGADAIDALDESGTGAPRDLLAFTRRTWEAACAAVARQRARRARLMVLVDDVLGVRPALDDRAAAERLAAVLVARYLERTPALPPYHARTLAAHGLGAEHLLRRDETRWLFSERELRAALVSHVHRELRSTGEHGAVLCESADSSTITVSHPDHGAYCLVHSGHTNCAGGYVELLAEAHRRGVRTLVAMVPMRCLAPVSVGTSLARDLYALEGFTVVNVAIGDPETDAPAIVTRG
ncbi:MAG: hypothetical protein HY084_09915 [Gemmatimonadetes bacterium]|nr:hypothetical protein [Gemmatimonadota bacterium]